jgi:4-carboxymuconolactone decarboxylase
VEPRETLRRLGHEILDHLRHGTEPPRPRPLYQSTVEGLGEYTSEALWGSVWARPVLDVRERLLATIAVLVATPSPAQLRTYLNSALNTGLDPAVLHEVAIQCSVHAGYPKLVNAMELLREVLEARGITPRLPAIEEVPSEELERRGLALWEQLFGDPPGPSERSAARALRDVQVRYAFGELLARPGLDLRERVIVAVGASLAVRDEHDATRWLGAGRRIGMSAEECDEVVLQCALYCGLPPAQRLLEGPGADAGARP